MTHNTFVHIMYSSLLTCDAEAGFSRNEVYAMSEKEKKELLVSHLEFYYKISSLISPMWALERLLLPMLKAVVTFLDQIEKH